MCGYLRPGFLKVVFSRFQYDYRGRGAVKVIPLPPKKIRKKKYKKQASLVLK